MKLSLPAWLFGPSHRAPLAPAGAGLLLHAASEPPCSAQLQGVRLRYGAQPVLQNLDWQLLPGQVLGLLGRNGAGKTTLLETLLGLREPEAGTVRLFGQDVQALDDAARERIGYVPQQAALFEDFTVAEMLAYFQSFYPRWNAARVQGLLQRWEIPAEQRIQRLSGGQQQRLSIIRALAHEPELLVLDEPVASLDPLARRDFLRELVTEVLDRGTTVVFSTHILSDLERVAFNVAFLREGRIALQAPLDQLQAECQLLSGPEPLLAELAARPGVALLARSGGRWLLRGELGLLPAGVQASAVTLDELFEALT